MYIFADVFANEYISGEGIQFFDKVDTKPDSFKSHWSNQTIGTKECDRSLLAFATTMKTDKIKELPCAIDLLGDFPNQVRGNLASTKTVEEAKEIEDALGIGSLRAMRDAEADSYLKNMMVRSSPLSPVVLLVFVCAGVLTIHFHVFMFSHDRR